MRAGDLESAIPSVEDLFAALREVPAGWWWSIGTCSVSNDASIGPDVRYCDKETLIRFDDGLHADLPHPSTIAAALRNCIAQAIEAQRAETAKTGSVEDESAVPKECAQKGRA